MSFLLPCALANVGRVSVRVPLPVELPAWPLHVRQQLQGGRGGGGLHPARQQRGLPRWQAAHLQGPLRSDPGCKCCLHRATPCIPGWIPASLGLLCQRAGWVVVFVWNPSDPNERGCFGLVCIWGDSNIAPSYTVIKKADKLLFYNIEGRKKVLEWSFSCWGCSSGP